jgi:phosphoglycerate dehydrogenase-like enzyme
MASPYPSSAQEMILPGRTLGVLGGGQLGRMFAHAAQPWNDSPSASTA